MIKRGSHKHEAPGIRNARLLKFLITCICVCLAFTFGFFFRGNETILKVLGFTSLITSSEQNPGATTSGNTYDSISARVAEIEGILQSESLDSYSLEDATNEILGAYANVTQDSYLRYYNEKRYNEFVKDSAGNYGGIGVLFSEYNGQAYAVDVFEGSEAENSGVQQGDFVIGIDGDRAQEWSATEVVNALSRAENSSLVITWRRPSSLEASGGEEYSTSLKSRSYSETNVSTELDEEVGYISVKQLTQNSASLVEDALVDLDSRGAETFVLDLRNNPGGYLTQAVDIASLFVRSGVIVEIQTKEGQSAKSATGNIISEKPLVVLVNGNTSSAAEVLVAALQDNQRTSSIIGETTMGKGSVQVTKELSFGGALRYTAGIYKTPLGHDIQGNGIVPDISVSLNESELGDNQKRLAIETAASFVSDE